MSHRWSDGTNDAIADGEQVIAFLCERCERWISIDHHGRRCRKGGQVGMPE